MVCVGVSAEQFFIGFNQSINQSICMLMFCLFCNLFGGVLVGSLLLGNVGVSPILFYEVQSINQSIKALYYHDKL
jgi:hypothetical protein